MQVRLAMFTMMILTILLAGCSTYSYMPRSQGIAGNSFVGKPPPEPLIRPITKPRNGSYDPYTDSYYYKGKWYAGESYVGTSRCVRGANKHRLATGDHCDPAWSDKMKEEKRKKKAARED